MICTNCFNADYQTSTTELTVTVNGEPHLLRDLPCETCPACGEITFTHEQSLEIDKQRVALEFGLKPLLAPEQLKTVRRVLNMKLEEICDLLQIGRNTYGRWERGEVAITPSMNLLVHTFIEKFPDAKVIVEVYGMENIEWIIPASSELEIELADSFMLGQIIDDLGRRYLTEELVDSLNGLKIEIFSNEHPPPHFRVKYAGDTATYAIADCVQLNGGLKKWYRNIREWHDKNKQKLINIWDNTRPSNCPVGKFRQED